MEFADLNDDIVADDWLIPDEEISKRRLIKQTPRYNVYKADWFGDVLVYEPIVGQMKHQHQQPQPHLASRRQQQTTFNQDELNCRLTKLVDLASGSAVASPSNLSVFSFSSDSGCSLSDSLSEQHDSAYSSISSTPRHYAADNIKSEFNFPASSNDQDDHHNQSLEVQLSEMDLSDSEQVSKVQQSTRNSTPVILNKESFKLCPHKLINTIGSHKNNQDNNSNSSINSTMSSDHQSSWFELNELRLVAHEGFMLFMGASMDRQLEGQAEGTSLVMQMNHPKSVSLYHLLHNSKFTASFNSTSPSTLDSSSRLFNYTKQLHHHHQLSNDSKLNICQQVLNAMTYLHDKNIVHGKLTSVNIYMELNQRVKISLIDDDERAIASPSLLRPGSEHNLITNNRVEFNLPSLTYLSPELIKTISVVGATTGSGCDKVIVPAHVKFDTNQLTKASDVFSFGTLIFELFQERFPFAQVQNYKRQYNTEAAGALSSLKLSILNSPSTLSPKLKQTQWNGNIKASANQLIYQIGSGQMECKNLGNLDKMKCPPLVELIIEKCWSSDPSMRPQFKQLASVL